MPRMKNKNLRSRCGGACAVLFAVFAFAVGAAPRATSRGVWWWRGGDALEPTDVARRMDFLKRHSVTEIYFSAGPKEHRHEDIRRFVKAASARGMRVACLCGDVSWIRPDNRGFAETLRSFLDYQKSAAPDEKFYALHLDVEPHQDRKLSEASKWQLYADFVLRAAAAVHAAGEKIEWDIPFWLDNKRVSYRGRRDVPLLEVVMDNADCVTLMSYRDTAQAMLGVSSTEIAMASRRKVRIVLGANTGESGEGSLVTYFEEGVGRMEAELARVAATLRTARLPDGSGVAIHHLASWMKLVENKP